MIQRFVSYTFLLCFGALCALTSCREDESLAGRTDFSQQLSARKVARETRSEPPNSYFPEDTHYRLWAYQPDGTYLFDPDISPKFNGILASESSGHYIEMDQRNAQQLRDAFDVYGFTDNLTVEASDNNTQIPPDDTSESAIANPRYTISYNSNIQNESGNAPGYHDYMRAYLHYDKAAELTSPVLEFKHILSRVRVQVIQQGERAEAGGDLVGIYRLRLFSATITGLYGTEVYDVRADKFSLPAEGAEKTSRLLRNVGEGEEIIPANASMTPFSESYIFPTLDDEPDPLCYLQLVIGGADAYRFSDEPVGEEGQYIVRIPLHDRNTPDDDGNYTLPLRFESNCSYMLRVVFSEDGVVMFTPLLYPWFDGEREGWEDGEGYEEQALGNTFLFDNLIWSDRNLGADEYLPTDLASFRKCTGFYYQYDRNIPYYPRVSDGKGGLVDRVSENISVYPIVSDPIGMMAEPIAKEAIPDSSSGNCVTIVDDVHDPNRTCAFNPDASGFATGLWSNTLTSPAPPGWRLPTQEEFLGIMPSSPWAGNITFLRNVNWLGIDKEAGTGNSPVFYKESQRKIIYVHVPNDDNYPNQPGAPNPNDENCYSDGGPNDNANHIVTGDPYEGYASEYIISRMHPEEVGKPKRKQYGTWEETFWGTIYAIKKVGTNEAYRLRWRITDAGSTTSANSYVLVIERFTATADDRLSWREEDPNFYWNYDWSRPVATIYIPIVGMIADRRWVGYKGKVGNFGTETILATSDPGEPINVNGFGDRVDTPTETVRTYKTIRIKIHGTNRINQFITPASDRRGTGAQIRLVRESTYQPDRE